MLEIRAFARKSLDRIFVLRRFEIENERCEMIDKARLEQKCSMWNIALTGEQLDQLDAFAQILVDYNQKVNLTAITDPEGIEDKHFLDSLLFASQPEVAGKMVDVGAGAGFPGIVTKIYKPELPARCGGSSLIWPLPVRWRLCPCWPSTAYRWSRWVAASLP